MILRYLLMKSTGKKCRQLEKEAKVGQLFSFVFLKLHINLIFMLKNEKKQLYSFMPTNPFPCFGFLISVLHPTGTNLLSPFLIGSFLLTR